MLRQLLRKLLRASLGQWQSKCGYKNFVMNDALTNLEKQCVQPHCYVPKTPLRKVAILGAGSDVGRITCLFLKQQKIIRILAMYDNDPEQNVFGAATDIAHLDTSTAVEAFQGRKFLRTAIEDADVILICGGCYVLPPGCNTADRDLFFENMQFVRTVTKECAKFAPNAIIAVQTPPVDANFALVKYTLIKMNKYNKRKVMGVNAVNSMRANQLFSTLVGRDPSNTYLPIICGTGRCTRVPCFSWSTEATLFSIIPYHCKVSQQKEFQKRLNRLTRLVREADDIICKVKSNNEQGHLSMGFSTARFVTNLMKGLFERPAFIDSVLVDQDSPTNCYKMETCATPVMVGRDGITKYMVPKINCFEEELLEKSKCDLEDMLNLGRCYALGEEYTMHPLKMPTCPPAPPHCPVVSPSETSDVSKGTNVKLDDSFLCDCQRPN